MGEEEEASGQKSSQLEAHSLGVCSLSQETGSSDWLLTVEAGPSGVEEVGGGPGEETVPGVWGEDEEEGGPAAGEGTAQREAPGSADLLVLAGWTVGVG